MEVCVPLVCMPNRLTMNVCEKLHRCATAPSPTLRWHSQASAIMRISHIRLTGHHLFLLPFCPQGFCSSSHPIYQRLAIVGVRLGLRAQQLNPEIFELREDRDHRCIRVAEKDTAANSDEDPAESLENGLEFEVALQLLPCMPALPIALHGKAPFLALDHEVNPISSYRPLCANAMKVVTAMPAAAAWTSVRPTWAI